MKKKKKRRRAAASKKSTRSHVSKKRTRKKARSEKRSARRSARSRVRGVARRKTRKTKTVRGVPHKNKATRGSKKGKRTSPKKNKRSKSKRTAPRSRAASKKLRTVQAKKKKPVAPLPAPPKQTTKSPILAHVAPMSPKQRAKEAMKRAKAAYDKGTLDAEYLTIALEFGISPHDAYSAAFGYIPHVGGKAA